MFEVYIKYHMSALYKDIDKNTKYLDFLDIMNKIYNTFYDYARVIIFHFKENNETPLSSLYLSLCSDYI